MNNIEHLNIEITKNCNQNCFYCFNDSGIVNSNKKLQTSKWIEIMKLLKDIGLKSVHFTGGEPFVHPDIIQILKGSLQLKLSTSILSNGYKLKEYVEKFPRILSKLSVAQISLDATRPDIHNYRRGYKNAWQDAIDAIFALDSLNIPVEISATIDNNTLNEIKYLVEFARTNNFKLVIRPLINTGRAIKLLNDSSLNEKIENELTKLDSSHKVTIVKDRFKYLSFDTLQKKYLSKESCSYTTINEFNVIKNLSKYVDISSVI